MWRYENLKLTRPGNFIIVSFFSLFAINCAYFFIGKKFIDERYTFSRQTQEVIDKTMPGLNLSQRLIFNITEIRRIQLRTGVFSDAESEPLYLQKEQALVMNNEDIFTRYQAIVESPREQDVLIRLKENWRAYLEISGRALSLLKNGDKEQARRILLHDALTHLIAFERENQALIAINNDYITRFSRGIESSEVKAFELFYSLMVLSLMFQCVIFTVIFRQHKINEKAINDAGIDPLTGLFNRRKILSEWLALSPDDVKVTILGDVDHFKYVNDTYGHHIGDFILIEFAKLLRQGCRGVGLAGRVGGEEFVIIAGKITLREAYAMVEKIRKRVAQTTFTHHSGVKVNITVSFGLSMSVNNEHSFEHMLSLADQKLYQSKNKGRNKTSY